MKRLIVFFALVLFGALAIAQQPYTIRNWKLNQIWSLDTSRVYIYNADTSDMDSIYYWGDIPAFLAWDSIYFPRLKNGVAGDSLVLFIHGLTGKLDTVNVNSFGGSAASKWTYGGTLTDLYPLDTSRNVIIGSGDPKGNLFRVDSGRVLFGIDTIGLGNKLMWIADKGAFRAGVLGGLASGSEWSGDSVGIGSVALGGNTVVSGAYGFAVGTGNRATGSRSFIAGCNSSVRNTYSSVIGYNSHGFGYQSHILGSGSYNFGDDAIIIGNNLLAKSYSHIVLGFNNDTTGYSTWDSTTSVVTDPVFTVGSDSANGSRNNVLNILKNGAVSFINYTFPIADGNPNEVLTTDGGGNVSWQPAAGGDTTFWQKNSKVLSPVAITDTVMVGATSNTASELFGVYNGSVIFSGNTGSAPTTYFGNQSLMWIPSKYAFRAGSPAGGASWWDNAAIGTGSASFSGYAAGTLSFSAAGGLAYLDNCIGMGSSASASGLYSVSVGSWTTASSGGASAIGYYATASGLYSGTHGYYTTSSGRSSFTTNEQTTASGEMSSAHNYYTTADAYAQSAFGRYNVTGGMTAGSWVSTDRLFVVGNGNGSGASTRNDAFRLSKDASGHFKKDSATAPVIKWETDTAEVGINTNNPLALLHVSNGTILAEGTTGSTPISGAGTRLMWIPAKGAFRAGVVTGTQWDNANIANYSIGMGYNAQSDGQACISMGETTRASSGNSIAMGYACTANDGTSGFGSAYGSMAIGYNSTAGGIACIAIGRNNQSGNLAGPYGDHCITIGTGNTATSTTAIAIGNGNSATNYSSVAIGTSNTSTARYSFNGGYYGTNDSYASAIFGRYNSTGYNTGSWVATDMLFAIGNGTGVYGTGRNNDAFRLSKDASGHFKKDSATAPVIKWETDTAEVGINTNNPLALLHVSNGTILAEGTTGSTPISGAGTRLMWIPAKYAFRAGQVGGAEWDNANVGNHSVAFGSNTTASGTYSFACGTATTADGGNASFSCGNGTRANGQYGSFAGGYYSGTTGNAAFSHGIYLTAQSYGEAAFGTYNVATGTTNSWVSTDPLFQIGNGTNTGASSNDAFKVLKNGSFYLGDASSTQDEMVYGNTLDSTLHVMWRTYIEGRTTSNMVAIDTLNAVRLRGSATVWEDLTISSASLGAGANAPTRRTFKNGIEMYAYNYQTADDYQFGVLQMSHTYREGTNISPHIHIAIEDSLGTDSCVFALETTWADMDDKFPTTTIDTVIIDVSTWGTLQHKLVSFDDLTGSGKNISSIVAFKITRLQSHPADTYDDWVFLLDFDIHYERDAIGSNTETTKD